MYLFPKLFSLNRTLRHNMYKNNLFGKYKSEVTVVAISAITLPKLLQWKKKTIQ